MTDRIEPVRPSARPIAPIDATLVKVRRAKRRAGDEPGQEQPEREDRDDENPGDGRPHVDLRA